MKKIKAIAIISSLSLVIGSIDPAIAEILNPNNQLSVVEKSSETLASSEALEKGLEKRNKRSGTEIAMPDSNLKATVNDAMNSEKINGKTDRSAMDPVYKEELEQLRVLNAENKNVTSIKGLEYATNLGALYLGYNSITDFRPLKDIAPALAATDRFGAREMKFPQPVLKISGLRVEISQPVMIILPDGTTISTPTNISDSGTYDSTTGKITFPWTTSRTSNVSYTVEGFYGKIAANVTQPVEFSHWQEVTMPDANLKAAVNEHLNAGGSGGNGVNGKKDRQPTDPVYKEEIEQLSTLSVSRKGIKSLQGLEYATGLEWLSVSHNKLPLEEFNYLKDLKITSLLIDAQATISPMDDISFLSNMPLVNLTMDDWHVSDLSPLRGKRLIQFSCRGNMISDFSPLGAKPIDFFAQNQTLSGSVQKVSGLVAAVSPVILTLPGGTKMSTPTNISDSGVYDSATGKIIFPWTSDQNKDLTYSYNALGGEITANVTQPVEFSHWQEVTMPDANLKATVNDAMNSEKINGKTDRSAMDPVYKEELEQLKMLNAENKNVTSIEGLEYATNLSALYLGYNSITDFRPLKDIAPALAATNRFGAREMKFPQPVLKISGLRVEISQPVMIILPDGTTISTPTNISDSGTYDSTTGKITFPWTTSRTSNVSYTVEGFYGKIAVNVTQPVEFSHWQEVTMPDANLKAAVNEAMNIEKINGKTDRKATDKVYKEELEQLNVMNNSYSITNFEGIQYATNLIELQVKDFQGTDVHQLNALKNLKTLFLKECPNLKILGNLNLPNLESIMMEKSQVEDISALRNSPNLGAAYLTENRISDFTPLSNAAKNNGIFAMNQQLTGSVQKVSGPAAVVSPVVITLPDGTKGTPTKISDSGVYDSATGKITIPWTSNQSKDLMYDYIENKGGWITATVTEPVEFTYSEGIWSKKGYFITYPKQIPLNNKNSEKEFHINLFNMDGKMTPYNGPETVHLQVSSHNNFKLIDSLNPLISSISYKVTLGTVELSSGSQPDVALSANNNNLLGKVKVLEEKLDTKVYGDIWQISIK